MSGATIYNVAKESGMSIATVSRVLSGSNYPVKPQTRKRILDAAEKVGYVPNMLARSLKTRVNNEIAVIIPYINYYPLFISIVGGIEATLTKSSYSMSLYLTSHSDTPADSLVNSLLGKMMAGVIIAADSITPHFHKLLYKLNQKNQLPIVSLDYKSKKDQFPGVYFDYFKGAKMAVEYLFDKGHSDIAFAFRPLKDHETRRARWAGIQAAYQARGYEANDYFEDAAETDFLVGVSLAHKIMQSGKKYTALAASNDSIAVGLLVGLAEQNIRVPDDISIIGFEDCIYAMMSYPALTTIRVPSEQMGEMAAHMLINTLEGKEPPADMFLEPKVIERASVKDLAKDILL